MKKITNLILILCVLLSTTILAQNVGTVTINLADKNNPKFETPTKNSDEKKFKCLVKSNWVFYVEFLQAVDSISTSKNSEFASGIKASKQDGKTTVEISLNKENIKKINVGDSKTINFAKIGSNQLTFTITIVDNGSTTSGQTVASGSEENAKPKTLLTLDDYENAGWAIKEKLQSRNLPIELFDKASAKASSSSYLEVYILNKNVEKLLDDNWIPNTPSTDIDFYDKKTVNVNSSDIPFYRHNEEIKELIGDGWSNEKPKDDVIDNFETKTVNVSGGKELTFYKEVVPFDFSKYIIWGAPILMFFLFFVVFFALFNKIKQNSKLIADLDEKICNITGEQTQLKTLSSSSTSSVESRLKAIEGGIAFLQQKLQNQGSSVGNSQQTQSAYKPQPYQPKHFSADQLSSNNPIGFLVRNIDESYKNGIFQISQISHTDAEFTINADETIQSRYLGSFASLLQPVCTVGNNNPSPKKIIVKNHGKLKMQNQVWEVVKKIEVDLQ